LAVAHWLLAVVNWVLAVVYWLLAVVYWDCLLALAVVYALAIAGCCLLALLASYWMLSIVYWLLDIGCCLLLSVGCCLLSVVYLQSLQSLHRLFWRACWQKFFGLQSLRAPTTEKSARPKTYEIR
jgi:hypothetical protein